MRLIPFALVLLSVAMTAGGCATHQNSLNAKSDKQASSDKQKDARDNKERNSIPASIYQGYNVTGTRF